MSECYGNDCLFLICVVDIEDDKIPLTQLARKVDSPLTDADIIYEEIGENNTVKYSLNRHLKYEYDVKTCKRYIPSINGGSPVELAPKGTKILTTRRPTYLLANTRTVYKCTNRMHLQTWMGK